MKIAACYFTLLAACFSTPLYSQTYSVQSPDNNITIEINNSGTLSYTIKKDHHPVILPSALGFEFKAEPAMGTGMEVISDSIHTVNETWEPVIKSKHAKIVNHYNEMTLQLVEKSGLKRRMDLICRAYNDGVAFRYKLYSSQVIGSREITRENTSFRLPSGAKVWLENLKSYTTSQESEFLPVPADSITEQTLAGLPMLIELQKNNYIAITEANIDNYPGFYIGKDNKTDTAELAVKLSPLKGEKEDGVKARFENGLSTPWRVIMMGSRPGDLITSELIQNLNEPLAIKDPSWIKPGLSAWDHWWSGEVKMDMPTIFRYIDLAAEMGWPYMLIDWQWYGPFNTPEADITKAAPQLNMPEILSYAKSKNVRCWLWIYSSDVNRNNNFEKAFPLYEQWGIAGIKIDFMDRDDQEMVNWYRRIIQKAAAHHLLVDFHGAFKPDGIIRTYPNMITREGVMGEEYSKFSTRITPRHNVTLPFTRMLAGQMDYTPGGFLNVTARDFKKQSPTLVMNTRCAELSKFVIYESPFMVNCEHPDHIIGQPGADFLKLVPTVWDDIRALDGYPGEFIILAKKSGDDWFIGAMTNEKGRKISIPLDFLSPGKYEMECWMDDKDAETHPQHIKQSKRTVNATTVYQLEMAGSGGFVARIRPVK
ncbi:glycoside hydrolase family 97 protein [Chitinophaga filiformis]|uniref:glycoside hydrolase family 97 protein n=1 Tax=Chitinophaga filiformis TaxID=104663 RepID=UPI001F3AC05B|nr:glycoside hydrolase family 97 protein [Chitinophaga filiformis]MCF6404824.1 glycoside hydrolase family 97 protein [Chitinophaga filiformis]